MDSIKNRKELQLVLPILLQSLESSRQEFLQALQTNILNKKVPFPLLEYLTKKHLEKVDLKFHLLLAIEIMKLEGMGKYVICGQLLRQRLPNDLLGSISTALGFIRQGDEWRACDLIAERVIGNALLNYPAETLSFANATILSPTKWDKRAFGVAIHYAVKKGLSKYYSEQSFQLLLLLSQEKDFHTKTGIGWAAKTVVKYHPEFFLKYRSRIDESARWFKSKIETGKAIAALNENITESLTPASQA